MMECVAKISTVKGTLAKNLVMKSHVVIVKSRSIRVSDGRKGSQRLFYNIGIRRGISGNNIQIFSHFLCLIAHKGFAEVCI